MISFLTQTFTTPDYAVHKEDGIKHYEPHMRRWYFLPVAADIFLGVALIVIGQLSQQPSLYYSLTCVGAAYAGVISLNLLSNLKLKYGGDQWFLYRGRNSDEAAKYYRERLIQIKKQTKRE